MDVFKEERCFANLALELFRNCFQFWKVSLNFYKIGLSLFVEKPFIFIHMKAKKLELKKEVIATLNKSKMSGLWGGLEGVTIDTCVSAGNLLCFTLFGIKRYRLWNGRSGFYMQSLFTKNRVTLSNYAGELYINEHSM